MGFSGNQYLQAEDDTLFTYQARLIGAWSHGLEIRHDTNYLNSLNTRFRPPGDAKNGCKKTLPKEVLPKTKKTIQKQAAGTTEKTDSDNAYILSDYAHISVVTVDPNSPLDKNFRALWEKGFYINFRKDGIFGFNPDTPDQYFFLPANKWLLKNNILKLTLDKASYSFKLPKSSLNAPRSFVTTDNEEKIYKMTLRIKEAKEH